MKKNLQNNGYKYRYEHLLILPVPFRKIGNELFVEEQARHGLDRWLDSFSTLAVAAPVIPENIAVNIKETRWTNLDVLGERVYVFPLPWAYRPDQFVLSLKQTVIYLSRLIEEARYLQFAISGFWGDWAAVAAEIAIQKKRPFAVHTDNVAHEFLLSLSSDQSFLKSLRCKLDSFLMKLLHRHIVSHCQLGLFHGMDTFNVYGKWMKNRVSQNGAIRCIHNIHDGDGFTENYHEVTIERKSDALQILYAGRLAPEKAPFEWLKTLSLLSDSGVSFQAIWAGDGPLMDHFQLALSKANLQRQIATPGFIAERKNIGSLYRNADIFLFTHITLESPRCLLEALRFGVPIVGYESEFSKEIIRQYGGGVLVPVGDFEALCKEIVNLALNRNLLELLKRKAKDDGKRFTSKAVFLERSELIKKYLN